MASTVQGSAPLILYSHREESNNAMPVRQAQDFQPIRPVDGARDFQPFERAQDFQQVHDPKPIGPESIEGPFRLAQDIQPAQAPELAEGQRTAFPACVYILND